jgi:hypothetical protein
LPDPIHDRNQLRSSRGVRGFFQLEPKLDAARIDDRAFRNHRSLGQRMLFGARIAQPMHHIDLVGHRANPKSVKRTISMYGFRQRLGGKTLRCRNPKGRTGCWRKIGGFVMELKRVEPGAGKPDRVNPSGVSLGQSKGISRLDLGNRPMFQGLQMADHLIQ